MPKGGKRPGAGRKFGSRNKAVIAREEEALLSRERQVELERLAIAGVAPETAAISTAGLQRGKEVLKLLVQLAMNEVARYQSRMVNGKETNPHADPKLFKEYFVIARDTANMVAPFQDHRFSTMMIGASVMSTLRIEGGLPDDQDGSLNGRALPPSNADAGRDSRNYQVTDVPSEPDGGVPDAGPVQGDPLRKAVG